MSDAATASLLDVAVPGSRTPASARVERHFARALAVDATGKALSRGLLADTVFAAAWLLAVDRLLGAGSVRFLEQAPAGDLRSSLHRIAPESRTLAFLTETDRLRKAAATAGDAAPIDATWHGLEAPTDAATAPLRVWVELQPEPRLMAIATSAVFDPCMVAALMDCVVRAADALSHAAEIAVGDVDLLGDGQRERLLHAWNPPLPPEDPWLTVPALFGLHAAAFPEAVALDGAEGPLRYGELDRRSNAFARRLAQLGIGPNDVVALAVERSHAAIVALLGILKLGAAYLPLDPRFPPERLGFMLRDASARLTLVSKATRERLPADGTIDMEALCEDAGEAEGRSLPAVAQAHSVAYVMYTSGSTGEPKGIEICHRSIVRLVHRADFMHCAPDEAMLHAAPLGFDASTLEIWGPLLNGARCVLHPEAVPTGPGLARAIREHGVTSAWLTAALFNAVIDDDPRHLLGLRQLLAGGEALSVAHVRRALEALPGTTLINGYGPTECTTFTATHRIPQALDEDVRSIPIGRPIHATPVYIVNPRMELVPIGAVGELCAGGPGLARGYLRRPELTAERFVPNPFGPAGERLYRTGDLARFLPDGTIEYIGRRDGQVKVRGFRIELGEIEAVLARHAAVRACAVVARDDLPGGMQLVAYVVPKDVPVAAAALRTHLAAQLPAFMVPALYVPLMALPVTANGKLDRRALPRPERSRPELAQPYMAPVGATEQALCDVFAAVLEIDGVGRLDNFFELGGTSLLVLQAIARLEETTGRELAATRFFSDPTPAALAAALDGAGKTVAQGRRAPRTADAREPIAVIGMAGRFPGAPSVDAFWENLCAGRDGITHFAPDAIDASVPAALRDDPAYVCARGVIDGVELFDADFFGIPPREAELMDPQQRLFMELCWEALERAGHVPDAGRVPIGVFGGMYNGTYFQRHVAAHPDKVAALGEFQVMLANEKDYIATRTANRLNLTGPAVSVHTACSTSLVAVAQAVQALRAGQCHMALAGGASVTCPPASGYVYQEGAMLSPDGRTRTFDANGQGTVFSDGAAVVLLKRLSDALADGDTIHAVIRGAAVNNDGGAKASFTAPSVEGQAAVIASALDDAGVDARSIGYVEAHGTATPLGDPVELEALTRAFRRDTDARGFCRIGSAKSNVGHLVIAAGAAGLIKAALALSEERIPPTIHFDTPNPKLRLPESPFVVNAALHAWPRGDVPRRAGVSAFGVGGTNAHAVLEEAPARAASEPAEGPQLLLLSARNATALANAKERLAAHLERHPDANLADVAHTLRVGRKAFASRAGVVATSVADAIGALRSADALDAFAAALPVRQAPVAFLFPGQGAQYAGMGHALHAAEPAFREAFDACIAALGDDGRALRDAIFGDDGALLAQTRVTQPALFCIEYALAQWWMSRGVVPGALAGHSVGELVGATLAGVFALDDAVRLVAQRGALMQAMPQGAMLAVRAGVDKVSPRLPAGVCLAAENAPGLCVVAGPADAIAGFATALEADGVVSRALQTSHAFHSPMMDGAVAPFEAAVAAVARAAPRIPIFSTLTGRRLGDVEACDPAYWARQLREPVRFSPALRTLLADTGATLLEIGPRATLTTLARQHGQGGAPIAIASLADASERERASVLLAAGRLWAAGARVDLDAFDPRSRKRRVVLPTYPFERKRHWVDARPAPALPTIPVPHEPAMSAMPVPPAAPASRIPQLVARLRTILEEVSGSDLQGADPATPLVELGLDSLTLTQVAIQVKQAFKVNVTFRQLMEKHRSLAALATHLDGELAPEAAPATVAPALAVVQSQPAAPAMPVQAPAPMTMPAAAGSLVQQVIQQQMQLMAQQLALLQGAQVADVPQAASPPMQAVQAPASVTHAAAAQQPAAAAPEADAPQKYDVKKAFGAIARIHTEGTELTERQRARLDAFMRRYIAKTRLSKEYTQQHRPHLADPRVVNGFRPMLKEVIYQLVIGKTKGARAWDLDGNEYVDVLNGFGMNMFGWQPDFINDAVRRQLDLGYEIGPQHPLAGEVAKLVCDITGHDRAGLCNTGSEAVMGAVRIARTVTGRNKIVMFTGAYHGIFDEVIVRAGRNLKSMPAAPGILANTSQNVIVLDYGTPESMQVIRDLGDELAAVLVEPVQSRRPDFQPLDFLRELREVTRANGSLLIFDEVVTGFRSHPAGVRGLFGLDADLCTYGKVVGGGFPIGVIAGKREFMDALDGGHWEFGDASIPTVGVTYFAGTFVRHPLALAAAKAVLEHVKREGPELQATLTRSTTQMVEELNAFCREVGAPIVLKNFSSVWRMTFTEDHPLQDLLFAMMRNRGIHVLDNFPCFMTTAHTAADVALVKTAFREAVTELQEAGFIPRRETGPAVLDATRPPVPGARIGKDQDGKPAWFAPHPEKPGKYVKVEA